MAPRMAPRMGRLASCAGSHYATLLQGGEQGEDVRSYVGLVGSFVLHQQLIHDCGYAVFSIDAGENITRGAAELQGSLWDQQHILRGMRPAAWSERRNRADVQSLTNWNK